MQSLNVYFDTPLDTTGIYDADYVYLDGTEQLASNGAAEVGFFGSADGDPTDPFASSPIEIQFAVTLNAPSEMFGAETADLTTGAASGTIGGTAKFCVGGFFSGSSFANDGCVAAGGKLYSVPLAEPGNVSFGVPGSEVDVWDQITLSGGASFGTIGQTFTQTATTPEPSTVLLILPAALLVIGCIAIRQRICQNRD